jgi:hypothetical protein
MKIYKNQNKQSAEILGLLANFEFAKYVVMSPLGVDITRVCINNILKHYEVTEYDKKTGLARIMFMNTKELYKYLSDFELKIE